MQTTHKNMLIAAGLLIGSLMMTGCHSQTPQGKPSAAPPPQVGVVTLTPQRVPITSELSGRVSARLVAEVRPQVGGIIQKRLFTEGSAVRAGQVLYQIDPSTYQAVYDSARAALVRAEANLVPARLKEKRFRELLPIKAVSQQDYDDADAALKQAEADVATAKAEVETTRINLDHTRVTAPISGRIGRSAVTVGALVTASQQTPLSKIQNLDSVYVDVTQSSSEMLRFKRGLANGELARDARNEAKVKLILEDGTSYPLEGKLKFSEVSVDPSTGSVTLRIVFDNPDRLLLPGMYVRAMVEEGVIDQAILAPQRGVTRNPAGQATALVVGSDGKVEKRQLQIDRAIGNTWLVSKGLKSGDRLIVEGLQKAAPGIEVKAIAFEGTSGAPPAVNTAAKKLATL